MSGRAATRSKVITAEAAARLIRDGATVGVEGAGRLLLSEAVSSAIERQFLSTGRPRGLTLLQPCGFGDDGDAGASHFAHEGLVRRVISPGYGDSPRMAALALANKIEAYCFPQGVVCQMVWAAASRKPRILSHVGLDTFVDPGQGGGRLNDVTTVPMVERVRVDGGDWLSFTVVPIDVAIIRGTTADEFGNMSMEHEPAILEPLTLAQAARANGGLVIAEVKRMARRGSLSPQLVRVPGILVDAVVVNPEAWQIHGVERYNPTVSGELRAPRGQAPPVTLDERMLVARRAAMALRPGAVLNIGFGISDGVPVVAAQEGLLDDLTITIEQGTIGGLPMRGRALAAQSNVEAIVDQISQFNFYQGGGLDLAFLSFAEVDAAGNVNVSKFGSRLPGCGGFIDISQNAKGVVFCGLFGKAGDTRVENGRLHVVGHGRVAKFRKQVEHVTFSGPRAAAAGKPVRYVTERAVFGLGPRGVELLELAPGCDLERDVLAEMEFRPVIAPDLRPMDPAIFEPRPPRAPRAVGCLGGRPPARVTARRERRSAALPVRADRRRRGGGDPRRRHADGSGRRGARHRRRRPERARALAARYDIPEVHESGEALAARAPVDAVAVLTPHHLHLPYVVAAANAGRHVLVEKAIAHTVAAADELIDACRARGVTLAGIFQNRFTPAARRLREAVGERGARPRVPRLGDREGAPAAAHTSSTPPGAAGRRKPAAACS